MSAVAAEPPQQEEVQQAAATVPAAKLFRYSQFLDVGDGAAECEHARDGLCREPSHFHAWCRLPNPYQEGDIREKAMAAKARRLRALRDPESDAAVVLESELAKLNDPAFTDTLIDELIGDSWAETYLEAQSDVSEREEFEHIEQDREEFTRQHAAEGELPEEEQSEEYRELRDHVQAFLDAVKVRLDEIEAPKRADFNGRAFEALFDMVRNRRMDAIADRSFLDTYNAWTVFAGTFKAEVVEDAVRWHRPMWDDIGSPLRAQPGTMYAESPEVIAALADVFTDLRTSLRQGSLGN